MDARWEWQEAANAANRLSGLVDNAAPLWSVMSLAKPVPGEFLMNVYDYVWYLWLFLMIYVYGY